MRRTRDQAATGAARPDRSIQLVVVLLTAAAAVIAVVVGVLVVTRPFEVRQDAGTSDYAFPASGTSPTPITPSLYRVVRAVTMEPRYLDCRTESACFAWFTKFDGSGLATSSERTSDGGATWQTLASVPLSDKVEPSCPTVMMCVAVADRDALAVTTNGGATWRLDPLPAADSAGWIDQVSCATVQECVVHLSSGLSHGTFLSTTDAGGSWTAATHVPVGAPGVLQFLRCDPSGRCIGAVSAALGTAYSPGHGPGLTIIRSVDRGLTWTVSVIDNVPSASSSAPGFLMSCSDALHCLYAGGSGVAVTSDGGLAWQQPATLPAPQAGTITSVSCTEGLHCSVALASALASQAPVIETTTEGMTWTAEPLPSSPDDPLQYVTLLSCPSPGGCIGLASTLSQEKSAFLESRGFASGIVQTSPQMLISSLRAQKARRA